MSETGNFFEICAKYAKIRNARVKNLCAGTIKAQKITTTDLSATNITTQNLNATNIIGENISIDALNTATVNTDTLNSNTVITNDLKATGSLYFFNHTFTLLVGADKQFKNIQQAINFLIGRIILGNVIIKVDPGVYSGFNVAGFQTVLNPLQIEGDMRDIAGNTFVAGTDSNLYTLNLTPQGSDTLVQIIENASGEVVDVIPLGLVAGDKLVFYNNDNTLNPPSLRFTESTVLAVNPDESFVVQGNITIDNDASSLTVLPNVLIRCDAEEFVFDAPTAPFPYLYNINVNVPVDIRGLTLLEPETGLTLEYQFLNFTDANFSLTNTTIMSIRWNDVTVDSVNYVGFSTPGALVSFGFNKIELSEFTVLGTGYNPQNSVFGPVSINDSTNTSISEMSIVGSVDNQNSNGILFFYNSSCIFENLAIIGADAVVNFLASKSTVYNSSGLLSRDCHIAVISADGSFVEINDSVISNADIGVISEYLSKVLLQNITFIDVAQEFCINDLSAILRDGVVVVAGPC